MLACQRSRLQNYLYAKRLAAMSEQDRQFIEGHTKNLKVDVVANGVDTQYFDKTKKEKTRRPTVLFVGQFKWLPNRDATVFLVREIWPKIKSQLRNAKLWIVGRNPPKQILEFASTEIKVDGSVADIRTAYAKSDVLLAPIRNGRGTKYKILEAMATKTPIVGTKLAIEGLDIKDSRQAFIAENADALAQKTVQILRKPALGQKLAEAAYQLVNEKYNWQIISAKLDSLYKEVAKK